MWSSLLGRLISSNKREDYSSWLEREESQALLNGSIMNRLSWMGYRHHCKFAGRHKIWATMETLQQNLLGR